VLEIGVGSGLNLAFYDPARVEEICGLDPAVELQARSRARAAAGTVPVRHFAGSAEEIPFASGTFDTVVTTFTLCSIPGGTPPLRRDHGNIASVTSDVTAASTLALERRFPRLAGRLDRVHLTTLPTRVEPLRVLGDALGADLWIKRDDVSAEWYGGNKPRKLE